MPPPPEFSEADRITLAGLEQASSRRQAVRHPDIEVVAGEAELPIVDWEEIEDEFIGSIEQGQHVVTLGKTGQGKSTFSYTVANALWELRGASVAAFITKKEDQTSDEQGWIRIAQWPPTYAQRRRPPPDRPRTTVSSRVLLWPPYTKASTYAKDKSGTFLEAIDEIMDEGGWVLYLDEASYLVQSMKLRTSVDELFTQARSNGITLIAGSQRPVWVSRGEVSQHTWIACFRVGDQEEATRAAEVMGDRGRFRDVIPALGHHQIILINSTTGEGVVTQVRK